MSQSDSTNWWSEGKSLLSKSKRLELLSKLTGIESTRYHTKKGDRLAQDYSRRAQELLFKKADSKGQSGSYVSEADDEMQQTVLGDLSSSTTINKSESSLGKIALAAGLLTAGLSVPATAYILKDAIIPPKPEPRQHEQKEMIDTDTDGVIEWELE